MSATLTSTPAADGYRMPAEWDDHAGCFLVWPERTDNWRDGAKPAQRAWRALIEAIASAEDVTVLVSHRQYAVARGLLPDHVRLVETTTNDAWVRDTGPSFVVNDAGDVRGVSWSFNAWGGLRGGLGVTIGHDQLEAPRRLGHIGQTRAEHTFFASQLLVHQIGNAVRRCAQIARVDGKDKSGELCRLGHIDQAETHIELPVGSWLNSAKYGGVGATRFEVGERDRAEFTRAWEAGAVHGLEQATAREISLNHLGHRERAGVGACKPGDRDRNLLCTDTDDIDRELRLRAR